MAHPLIGKFVENEHGSIGMIFDVRDPFVWIDYRLCDMTPEDPRGGGYFTCMRIGDLEPVLDPPTLPTNT